MKTPEKYSQTFNSELPVFSRISTCCLRNQENDRKKRRLSVSPVFVCFQFITQESRLGRGGPSIFVVVIVVDDVVVIVVNSQRS